MEKSAMPSKRVREQVEYLLDKAGEALISDDWDALFARAEMVLTLDPDNDEAQRLLDIGACAQPAPTPPLATSALGDTPAPEPIDPEPNPLEEVAAQIDAAPDTITEAADQIDDAPDTIKDVMAQIDKAAARIAEAGALSEVVARILTIRGDDEISGRRLAQTIESDPELAAKVLELVNSGFYPSLKAPVASLQEAVLRLGVQTLADAAVVTSVIDTTAASTTLDDRAFWQQALTVGLLAETQAATEQAPPHDAFIAGVLHNIGRLAFAHFSPRGLNASLDYAAAQDLALHDAERVIIGYDDAALGAALALRWNFSPAIAHAIANQAATLAQSNTRPALYVARARALVRSWGGSDGVEETTASITPIEWRSPPLANALAGAGCIEELDARIDAFLRTVLSEAGQVARAS